jgi:hypothetical protein
MKASGRSVMGVAALVLALLMSGAAHPAAAAGNTDIAGGEFVLTVSSIYARSLPSWDSAPVFSLFEGDTLPVHGYSDDGRWLLVKSWQLKGWVPLHSGVISGAASQAPPEMKPVRLPQVPAGVVPTLSDRARAIFLLGLEMGNRPDVFAKVGDCNTENGRFLSMFDEPGSYRLGEFAYLQQTINNYAGSFEHTSVAAHSGFSPAAVLSPVWADPSVCRPGEAPLHCEYRRLRPSAALVNLGTHPGPNKAEYEATMRMVVEESIRLGVLPILATKADDAEGGGWVNDVIRGLADEYEVPLWDFWKAAQPLPANGLASTGIHLTYGRPYFDDDWAMTRGWTWRNLTALLALDAVYRGGYIAPQSKTLHEWR